MNRCRTTCKVSLHKEKGRPTKNMHGLPYPYRLRVCFSQK